MRRGYVSGPMRGYPDCNYPAFMAAAKALREHGWWVFNPAEMDEARDHEPPEDGPAAWRHYAKRDTRVLIELLKAENGDAVVVLPGWGKSVGASAEVALGQWVGLKVLTLEEALK